MRKAMTSALLAALVSTGFSTRAHAAQPDGAFQEIATTAIVQTGERQIVPDRFRLFTLDRTQFAARLAQAPREGVRRAQDSALTIDLPLPDGGSETFRVVESPIMEPELAAKYPQIRTYLGQGTKDPSASVRFDLTPKGFHAQILGRDGTQYIDPYQTGDLDHYIVYNKRDYTQGHRGICSVTGEAIGSAEDAAKHFIPKVSSGGTLRTYRLAMAATGEYTAFHGGTVIDGLAAIVTTVNRVDGIYEREVSVRMVLIGNDDLLIYTNASTDPYANTSGDLAANQTNTNNVIGSANYDIGHLVGTGGGGIAGLGVVCSSSKARGLTGSPAPVGDAYDVDYVAHEMGHQFGGDHPFNGSGINCAGGNRNASTAYEVGSGITIQAYAGICGGDDLQPNSDDYFHRISLNEILAYTTTGTGGTCGTTSATGNAIPTVSAPAAFTIPGRTPFTLTASGSDGDSDPLTYVWEEFDLATNPNAEGVLDPTVTSGPLFRGFDPMPSSSRTFPSLRYILNNANAVPATAPLEGTASPNWMAGEVLPNVSRTMNFRVTVRDNKAGGGGTNEATTALTIDNTTGPFAVTAPNTAVSFAAGSTQTVTWNVAGTTGGTVLAANVKISLSVDGGITFPFVLAASTANDGTESVTIPSGLATTQARVKVEAVGNVFFDISDADFTITDAGNTPPSITVTNSVATRQGSPTASAVVATVADAQDSAGALTVAIEGAPAELTVSVQNNAGNVTLSATAACTLVAPTSGTKTYPLTLRVTDSGGAQRTASVNVNVGSNSVPTLGNYTNLNMIQGEVRTDTPTAAPADANNNLVGTTVTPTVLPGGGTIAIAPTGVVTVTTLAGTTPGTYAVRPTVTDVCGATEERQFNVVVGAPAVTLAVASSAVTTGNGLIEPNECNSVNITLRNDGNVAATGVSAVLSTSTPNVTITQANSAYPDLAPGASATNTTAFQVSTAAALTCFTSISLTLTVNYTGPGSPAAPTLTIPVGDQPVNYVFTSSSGATLPNDGVLLAGSQVDDAMADLAVPAGFNFSIYNTAVAGGSTLRVSSNGNLQVRSTQGATDAGNAALPAIGTGANANTRFPATAPTLFMQWDDWRMDGAAGGAAADAGIYTKLQGSAPNRDWIIEWRGRIRGDGAVTTDNNRAAIVFHEGSNSFDYIYLLTGTGPSANAAGSTIGAQAANTGTTFTQFALDTANIAPGTKLTATIPAPVCTSGSGTCGAALDAIFKDGFE